MSQRHTIDARQACCPGPLIETISALKFVEIGDELEVWSTNEGMLKDLPEWIAKAGHEMVAITECEGYWSLVMRKAR